MTKRLLNTFLRILTSAFLPPYTARSGPTTRRDLDFKGLQADQEFLHAIGIIPCSGDRSSGLTNRDPFSFLPIQVAIRWTPTIMKF